ncbi:hypothetical protein D043_5281A, partial [Vibrio parahaemolyticus EKP-021]|jgi:hypothetical protein
MEGL